MSRAERRAYQRMTKNQDRFAVPQNPALRARMERQKAKRDAIRAKRSVGFTRRYVTWTIIIGLLVGLLFFSLQWSNGLAPAFLAGGLALAVVVALAVVMRLVQKRAAARS
jgi:uncharacterized integral membrane protein